MSQKKRPNVTEIISRVPVIVFQQQVFEQKKIFDYQTKIWWWWWWESIENYHHQHTPSLPSVAINFFLPIQIFFPTLSLFFSLSVIHTIHWISLSTTCQIEMNGKKIEFINLRYENKNEISYLRDIRFSIIFYSIFSCCTGYFFSLVDNYGRKLADNLSGMSVWKMKMNISSIIIVFLDE